MIKVSRKIMGKLVKDQKGASAIEYAILVGAIGAVLATGVHTYGVNLGTKLSTILTGVDTTGVTP